MQKPSQPLSRQSSRYGLEIILSLVSIQGFILQYMLHILGAITDAFASIARLLLHVYIIEFACMYTTDP